MGRNQHEALLALGWQFMDEEAKARLHIQIGTWGGEAQTLKVQGAFSDFIGLIGLSDAVRGLEKMSDGTATLGEMVKNTAKPPANRLINSITPFWKTPFEILFGSAFPDAFNPRKVRDWKRHIAQTLAVEHEYDLLTNQPSKGYLQSWKNAVVYSKDPGEIAYNKILGAAYKWNDKRMGRDEKGQHAYSDRSMAVYDYKRAMKFGDTRSASGAKKELERIIKRDNASGLRKITNISIVLRKSKERAHPTKVIPRRYFAKFMKTLTKTERKQYVAAVKWWTETFK